MPTDPLSGYPWYWYGVLIVLATAAMLGALWAHRVWREARGEIDDENCTTEDLLSPLVLAYKSGQMSEDEYRRIRDSLLSGGTDRTARPGSSPCAQSTLRKPPRGGRPAAGPASGEDGAAEPRTDGR